MATGLLKFIQFNQDLAYPTCNCSGITVSGITTSGCCPQTLDYLFTNEIQLDITHGFDDGFPTVRIFDSNDSLIPQTSIMYVHYESTNKSVHIRFQQEESGVVKLMGIATS